MRCSIFWGTCTSLLFFGFTATTTALVIRDHPFNTEDWSLKHIPVNGGRFSENCQGFQFNPTTCVLAANCTKSNTKERPTNSLNLNKCFWYHKVDEKENDLGWQVDWNEKDEDPHGITNFCNFCDTTLGIPEAYEYNPLVLWTGCLPPDNTKETVRKSGSHNIYLDRYIANNDGYMECFGRRGE